MPDGCLQAGVSAYRVAGCRIPSGGHEMRSKMNRAKHTNGPWKSKKWDSINRAIVPLGQKDGMVIALVQFCGFGGRSKDIERAANIRLIEESAFHV
jgi:hypothetical protein